MVIVFVPNSIFAKNMQSSELNSLQVFSTASGSATRPTESSAVSTPVSSPPFRASSSIEPSTSAPTTPPRTWWINPTSWPSLPSPRPSLPSPCLWPIPLTPSEGQSVQYNMLPSNPSKSYFTYLLRFILCVSGVSWWCPEKVTRCIREPGTAGRRLPSKRAPQPSTKATSPTSSDPSDALSSWFFTTKSSMCWNQPGIRLNQRNRGSPWNMKKSIWKRANIFSKKHGGFKRKLFHRETLAWCEKKYLNLNEWW